MTLNPFEITKAVDFSDDEIAATYVSYGGSETSVMLNPRSPMNQFLVGGKGGGRTHLMRYFSFPLQIERAGSSGSDIKRDGYIGIYLRCSGLNGSRFSGKRQSSEAWDAVFSYYMDLWMAQLLLGQLIEYRCITQAWGEREERLVVAEVLNQFAPGNSSASFDHDQSLAGLQKYFIETRRSIDYEVNNAALTGSLDVRILASRGVALFATTSAIAESLFGGSPPRFTFLLDEFENLSAAQQRYVNTLLREKPLEITFVVGSRRYGIRTKHETLSAGESNRSGSEYTQVVLEQRYSANKAQYSAFCAAMASSRLASISPGFGAMQKFLHKSEWTDLSSPDASSRAFKRLRSRMEEVEGYSAREIEDFERHWRRLQDPIVQRYVVFRAYQEWSSSGLADLNVVKQALAYEADRSKIGNLARFGDLQKWAPEMRAFLIQDRHAHQLYSGLHQFVLLSGYLPRNFLILLKQSYSWSVFLGENALEDGISVEAQQKGVLAAASWYLRDSLPLGAMGGASERALQRLGSFLRAHRFSDKPSEISCSTVSFSEAHVSAQANAVITSGIEYGLFSVPNLGRRDRNTGARRLTVQVAPMLAPLHDLPLSRRGILHLSQDEVHAIFDPGASDDDYEAVLRARRLTWNMPFTVAPASSSKPVDSDVKDRLF